MGTKRGAVALQGHSSRAGQAADSHCRTGGCRVSTGDFRAAKAIPQNCLMPEPERPLGSHPGHRNWHPERAGFAQDTQPASLAFCKASAPLWQTSPCLVTPHLCHESRTVSLHKVPGEPMGPLSAAGEDTPFPHVVTNTPELLFLAGSVPLTHATKHCQHPVR